MPGQGSVAQTLTVTLDQDAAAQAAYEAHVARNTWKCEWANLREETRETWRRVVATVLEHVEAVKPDA